MPKSQHIEKASSAETPGERAGTLPAPVFDDPAKHLRIYQGDCVEILVAMPAASVDLIFADPPYFLSNGGITCHAGKMVSVNKGTWDKSRGAEANHEFNRAWLTACQRVLKPNGTIWVSGTSHVIHSVGFAMQQLGFKLLNDISWVKPNPPPNLSCRYFTHATETIIWAAKNIKSRHTFHYAEMKLAAGGKQMKSVWTIPPPEAWEKKFGKHPAQKPGALLERILLASSNEGDLVLDPFLGSGTTLVAALRFSRCVIGVEVDASSAELALTRICTELVQVAIFVSYGDSVVDPRKRSMDRSEVQTMAIARKLVRKECSFYFVGAYQRDIVFSVVAESMDEAWQKFFASSRATVEVLFVIKTQTEIYLAQ
jgi:site-specific DNA-methyltransferase (adenine-specific)